MEKASVEYWKQTAMDIKVIFLLVLVLIGCFFAIQAKEDERDALSCPKYCELVEKDVEACEDISVKEERKKCRKKALSDGAGRDCHCRKI